MASWSQSDLLHAIGWATLNSFWQMAILWCLYMGITTLFMVSAANKYRMAVGAVIGGFAWFLITLLNYFQDPSTSYAIFSNSINYNNSIFQICLLSASVTYLVLLIFPVIKFYKNWVYVQRIKTQGIQKANLEYRLFIQKIAPQLGVKRKVRLLFSSFVSSPLTVGYIKPIILLPVAAINNLSIQQVESILLHELSHIRRQDYLINLLTAFIHTLLYFNPFVKKFIQVIELEREACCDNLVLQFGYDKVGYATTLLQLERSSIEKTKGLVLAAAGKQNLLTRIEKIVGMEKKKASGIMQFIPVTMAILCILLFNSVLIINDSLRDNPITYHNEAVITPWQLNNKSKAAKPLKQNEKNTAAPSENEVARNLPAAEIFYFNIPEEQIEASAPAENFLPVEFNAVDGQLSKEEKSNVSATIAATRKVAGTLQWKQIESSIGEVMDKKEKAMAKQEYLHELDKVAWHNVEENLKANYDKLDWNEINKNVTEALAQIQLDSLQTVYSQIIAELDKTEVSLRGRTKLSAIALPDVSIYEIQKAKDGLRKNLDSLKRLRIKKVVSL